MREEAAERIVLVETSPEVIEAFARALAGRGAFHLDCVPTLAEARARLAQGEPSLVVFGVGTLDLDLPGSTRATLRTLGAPAFVVVTDDDVAPTADWVHDGLADVFHVDDLASAARLVRAFSFAAERARVEDTVREQSRVLHAILDDAEEGVVFVDDEARFTLMNDTAERMMGMGEVEEGPDQWVDLYGVYERDEATRLTTEQLPMVKVLGGARVVKDHVYVKNAHLESGVHVLATGRPLPSGGGALVMRDVTVQVRARRDSERYASRLESSNMELSQFAYRTSHDLKSPLVTVRRLSSAIVEAIEAGDHDEVLHLARMIGGRVAKLESLVTDILDLTRAEVGQMESDAIPLRQAVLDIAARLEAVYVENEVEVRCDVAESVVLHAPKVRLVQVVENLVSNGIKYRDPSKPRRFVRVSTEERGGAMTLVVEDNGVGIPTEFQPRVFEMFQRFHPELSQGSGLGMYIVKKHLEKLEASLSFESSSEGTRFEIAFPESVWRR